MARRVGHHAPSNSPARQSQARASAGVGTVHALRLPAFARILPRPLLFLLRASPLPVGSRDLPRTDNPQSKPRCTSIGVGNIH